MRTARDTKSLYQATASAGGKLRKTHRNIPTTPYARPRTLTRNKNLNLLTKIVDSASRLLHAGAHKLCGVVFETNEEPQNVPREKGQRGNSAGISAATGISDLEQMLQQKTFTRPESERLTALLHSRSSESSFAGKTSSGSLRKHGDERDNLHAAISTPIVTSRVLEEEIATPAELAKAYIGSRSSKVALRQDLVLHNNATGFLKAPSTLIASKIANGSTGFVNGFTTPRSRGRLAMYNMARTTYARSSTLTQKGITSSYGREEALPTSQSAFQHQALKRRSSVLDDDIGSGGPLRSTRQKANLLTLRDERELGYTALQQPDHASQKLLLMNESEPKNVMGAEQNSDTSMHGLGSVSGCTNVPTQSTQTATKILQPPNTLIAPKVANGSTGFENATPRSRGRSAMYSMARTPYERSPSTFTKKGITSSYGREEALTSYQSAFQQEGKMALKRRSSVLVDDIGSGGPLRRTRQKANLLTQTDKREVGYTDLQQPEHASQKLLLMNESEPKIVMGAEQNSDTSMHGLGSVSGCANVPTHSTQTATKILQPPNTLSSPNVANGSTVFENGFTTPRSRGRSAMYRMARTPYTRSPSTFTQKALNSRSSVLDDDIGSAGPLRRSRQKANLLTVRDKRELGNTALQQPDHTNQKLLLMNESEPKIVKGAEQNRDTSMHASESVSGYANAKTGVQHHERLQDSRELTSKGKEKVEDDGRNMMSSVNGELSVTSKDKEAAVIINEPPLKLPDEPPQKKCAFQMSASEDDDTQDKAPAVITNEPPLKLPDEPPQMKCAFKMSAPEDDSFEIDDDDEVSLEPLNTSTLPEVSRTPALVENNKQMFPEVVEVLDQAEPKESEKPVSCPKIDVGFGESVSEQGLGFKVPASPPLTTNTQNNLLPEATLPMDNVVPENDSNSFTLFGTSAERVSPFAFSANLLSDSKPSASSVPKALESSRFSNSVTTNGNDEKSENIFGKVESNKTESHYHQPANIFGKSESKDGKGNDQKTANIFGNLGAPASPALPGATTVISTTTAPTPAAIFSTSTPTPVIPLSVPAPVFSFGSATSTIPRISVAETGNTSVSNDKDLKSNLTNSPFARPFSTITTTGSGLFRFNSPAVTSTTKNGSQANTQASVAVTPSVPFLFGSGTTGTTSIPSPFLSSAMGTSSSLWDPAKSSRLHTAFNFGASAGPTPSATTSRVVFGVSSTRGSGFSFGAGATSSFSTPTQNQSFGNPTPPVFGTPTHVFGTGFTPNNNDMDEMVEDSLQTPKPVFGTPLVSGNDHMSMDSMVEDSIQTPTPVLAFGQTPLGSTGFVFGSTTPTSTSIYARAEPQRDWGCSPATPTSTSNYARVEPQRDQGDWGCWPATPTSTSNYARAERDRGDWGRWPPTPTSTSTSSYARAEPQKDRGDWGRWPPTPTSTSSYARAERQRDRGDWGSWPT